MPFEKGSFAMSIFKLSGKLPEDVLEKFNSFAAGKLDDIKDEIQIGWVSGRTLLDRQINEETSMFGGHILLNLRIAQRKIPSILLNAKAKMEELAYISASKDPDIPKKVKKEIKESIKEKILPQMVPSMSGTQFVIDGIDNSIYLGAVSTRQIDNFLKLFHETLKITPIQLTAEELMIENKFNPTNYNGISFTGKNSKDEDIYIGRDFLTWLWYFTEEGKGEIETKEYGKFAITIDGPLSFIANGEGALESVVKKGNPLRSAEAQAALNVGKKLKKAKIIFVKDEENWSFNFDPDTFIFSSVNLPPGEEMDYISRLAERVNYIQMLKTAFKTTFKTFLNDVTSHSWKNELKKIHEWVINRKGI